MLDDLVKQEDRYFVLNGTCKGAVFFAASAGSPKLRLNAP